MTQKQRIAVDLDDTLAATIEGTLAFVSQCLGREFEKGDITAVLFGGHAWHLLAEENDMITRASDWKQVKEYFNAKS